MVAREQKIHRLNPYECEAFTPGEIIGIANKIRAGKVSDFAIVWKERKPNAAPEWRSGYHSKSGDCGNDLVGALEWVKFRILKGD